MNIFRRFLNWITKSDGTGYSASDKAFLEALGIDANSKAIQEVTYFTCLKVLSETMGKLPLKLYHTEPSGGRERADTNDQSLIALTERPNPYMTPATFWSTIETLCEHYGNSYVWIDRTYVKEGRFGGAPFATYWIMNPANVSVIMDDAGIFGGKGRIYYQYSNPDTGETYIFQSDDVMHFKAWLTWDGIIGKSVREILRDTIGGAMESQGYLNKLYESGLTASSVLQYTGDLDETKRAKLEAHYNAILTGKKNAGKVVALPVGITLSPLNMKLTDSQFYELKKYTALQIAAAFGVKPNQINDYEKSSYANSESQQLAFLVDTMLFRINQYEQEINYKVLTSDQRRQGLVYKFNERALLRTNFNDQMNGIVSAVQTGIYTPNEGRALVDLPGMEGGDVLIVNGTYVPLTDVGAAYKEGSDDNGSSDD